MVFYLAIRHAISLTTDTPAVNILQSSRNRIKFPQFLKKTKMVDRDQTVSRRSEPNSRTTLFGEQPNPWNQLQLQDVMSRHRGAKRIR